jgi:hypothetical protein
MIKFLITLVICLTPHFLIAQEASSTSYTIKDFSLRDYEAPDIRFKRLYMVTNMNGGGGGQGNVYNNHHNGDLRLNLFNYGNTDAYQGSSSASVTYKWQLYNRRDTLYQDKSNYHNVFLNYSSVNRWYVSEKHFFAIHPRAAYRHDLNTGKYRRDTVFQSNRNIEHAINLSVFLSVGSGRIQPVAPAREALNILISLEKYNRLAVAPDSVAIDSLARIANKILYKRFYDGRFKRIYQLEELDKALQEMGLVTNPDMVYAANLSDIWNYGTNYSRGAGSRWEIGVVPGLNYLFNKQFGNEYSNENLREGSSISGYGFVGWTKKVPLSFSLQSDFSATIAAGYSDNKSNSSYEIHDTMDVTSQTINVNYIFGYYPNTRTYLGVSPSVTLAANQMGSGEDREEYVGMTGQIQLNSYYYISPRFRVSLRGNMSALSDGYLNREPVLSPIIEGVQSANGRNQNLTGENVLSFSYGLSINYALF